MSQVQTLNAIYTHAIKNLAQDSAFRYKADGRYRDVSTGEFARMGSEVALGLISLGLKVGDKVAILSETRFEWVVADMGILTAGLVSVPIYPTLPEASIEYILQDSEARALILSTGEQAEKLKNFRAKNPDFTMVGFDVGDSASGITTLGELQRRGRQLGEAEADLHTKRTEAVDPEDIATIIYTSGTTGPPKGVMLSHRNITSNVLSALQVLPMSSSDTALSFLPLSHILERMAGLYCMVYVGATLAYAESIDTVPQNLQEVRPTVMISVPRFYEKMYARIMDAALQGGPIKKNLFFWARSVGLKRSALCMNGESPGVWLEFQYKIAKTLVFSKLKKRTGGRLRFFCSGGAPLSKEIAEFFYAAGLPILEGYGLTETSPVLTMNSLEGIRPGTVGKPIPGVEIKIAEDGEIIVRGPGIMKGYFNRPEDTAEAMSDGWFKTGDIGHLDPNGYLVITDRKKDLIVTAGGKNVAPQPIENKLKTDKFLSEVVVIGDRRPYLVALVVPNFENLEIYARSKNLSYSNTGELVAYPAICAFLKRRVDHMQRDAAPFESLKKIHVLDRELVIGEELTPTLKVKRKEVGKRFHDEIEALYSG